ncbi:MAG TPA: GNAT family N-acetyltransferase [Thermoleophilaceae bacterium]|nr:GNAT family N-acetyltransferase [Thermoleophilaceae bacterium]
MPELTLRPARVTDAGLVAPLLYSSAAGMYDRFAGSRKRALRLLERSVETPGNSSSAEIVTVAEQDETVAGALAAFPVGEAALRSRAFLSLTARSIPPWRWFGAAWLFWAGAHATPSPPQATLYVDALAVDEHSRRRGVARALLGEAERQARERGLPAVSLDTALDNKAARSLYLSEGFDEVAYRPPARGLPGFVALVKPVARAPLS